MIWCAVMNVHFSLQRYFACLLFCDILRKFDVGVGLFMSFFKSSLACYCNKRHPVKISVSNACIKDRWARPESGKAYPWPVRKPAIYVCDKGRPMFMPCNNEFYL